MGISRDEAADAAAAVGCRVDDGVTRHTTMLVVGGWELRVTGGYKKSAKQLKAERLVGRGQRIRILRESDFLRTLAKCEAPRAV
jgi:DNA polymerase-3 subunit epsilon